jgi:hypothetical protein
MNSSRVIEWIIQQAVDRGEFENLPGEGKPLKLDPINSYLSKEQVIMNKMLKDSGLLPIEILIRKEIDDIEQKLEDSKNVSEQNVLKAKLKELEIKYDIQVDARRNFFDN